MRFDIKEGLKDMIRDSAPAFDAAQVQRNLIEQKRRKQVQRQSADDLKLSTLSNQNNYSDLQGASNSQMKASPVFGGSHR